MLSDDVVGSSDDDQIVTSPALRASSFYEFWVKAEGLGSLFGIDAFGS